MEQPALQMLSLEVCLTSYGRLDQTEEGRVLLVGLKIIPLPASGAIGAHTLKQVE